MIWFFLMSFLTGFIVIFFQSSVFNKNIKLSGNNSWEVKDNDSALFHVVNFIESSYGEAGKFFGFFETTSNEKEIRKRRSAEPLIVIDGRNDLCNIFNVMNERFEVESCHKNVFGTKNLIESAFSECSRFMMCCPAFDRFLKVSKEVFKPPAQVDCEIIKSLSDSVGESECFDVSIRSNAEFLKSPYMACRSCS